MMVRLAESLTSVRRAIWHLRKGGFRQVHEWSVRQRSERQFASPASARGVEGQWVGRGTRRRLSFAPETTQRRGPRRAGLRVGVILDEFSAAAFHHEWTLVPLAPTTWEAECRVGQLDFVLVESAWSGNRGLWSGKLAGPDGPAAEYRELLARCRSEGIPSVFWNKEDPPHYEDFLAAARLSDVVFTSDINRIEAYRRDLGHDRVDVLPFAAQPAIHNPVRPRVGRHARDIAFAGMYFAHKYPERRGQLDVLLGGAIDASPGMRFGLEIFSRLLAGAPQYQFPQPYAARVVGSLTYQQMLSAYKAYRVFLNVNSVIDSPSMCARRIFEISASGTPVISAPSLALREFFRPEEVVSVETRAEAAQWCRALVRNGELNDRTAHRAQRRIWSEHTYAHRAEAVVAAVRPDMHRPVTRPSVSALVPTIRGAQIEALCRLVGAQQGLPVQLVLLAHGIDIRDSEVRAMAHDAGIEDVVLLREPATTPLGECLNLCAAAASGDVLAKMDDDDYYGPQYLSDQVFALEYSGADVVGKQAHYMHLGQSNAVLLRSGAREHRFTDLVAGPTIVARAATVRANPFPALPLGEDTGFLRGIGAAGGSIYSADRFNYAQLRRASGHTWQIDDLDLMASGHIEFYGGPHEHVDV